MSIHYSFRAKLHLLMEALEAKMPVQVDGSLFSEILFLIGDLLALVRPALLRGSGPIASPILQFVDAELITQDHKDWERRDQQGSGIYWDPLDRNYYKPGLDDLGNQAQVIINFEKIPIIAPQDRKKVGESLDFLTDFLEFLAIGRIDWPKAKHIHKFYTQISSMRNRTSGSRNKNDYHFRNRRKQSEERKMRDRPAMMYEFFTYIDSPRKRRR